jgi:hypothetical protein
MRIALVVIAVALMACTEHGKGGGAACVFMGDPHQIGEHFPAGDGCNDCTCDIDGVHCTVLDCFDGGTGDICGPSGGCQNGPLCGEVCCEAGESCTNGSCSCGGQAACTMGDVCASGGPAGSNASACGAICCGVTGPCPI